jgi:hypothetical protein
VVTGGVVGGVVGAVVPAVAMVIFKAAEAVLPLASVTANVKVLAPELAGIPDKTPD